MILILAACGCLTLGGVEACADETPVRRSRRKDLESDEECRQGSR